MAEVAISPKLAKDLKNVSEEFPSLQFKVSTPFIEVWGVLPVIDSTGYLWDSYTVLIYTSHEPTILGAPYPYSFPVMHELGGKIPKLPDRHINEDGSCCVCVEPDQRLEVASGITLSQFIQRYAIPFLANQKLYDLQGSWSNGDYAHGTDGIHQRMHEIASVNSVELLVKAIKLALHFDYQPIDSKCFCGSRKSYKLCHLENVYKLSRIGQRWLCGYLCMLVKLKNQEGLILIHSMPNVVI